MLWDTMKTIRIIFLLLTSSDKRQKDIMLIFIGGCNSCILNNPNRFETNDNQKYLKMVKKVP